MLNVCVCVLSRYLSPRNRDLVYVKCLCVLSRYLSPHNRDLGFPLRDDHVP